MAFFYGTATNDYKYFGAEDDIALGFDGSDFFYGGEGQDTLYGHGDADYLYGNGGNDKLYGGNGDDLLIGGAGADRLDGGEGFDTVDYSASAAGILVALGPVYFGPIGVFGPDNGRFGDAEGDRFVSIERVIGSRHADTLYGSANRDVLDGAYGDDALMGFNGDDELRGGEGADMLEGNAGRDLLLGGYGDDTLYGGSGDDTMIGGGGADTFFGGERYTSPNDPYAFAGFDTVSYAESGAAVRVFLTGGGTGGDAQGDTYREIDAVIGSRFDDYLGGDAFANTLSGGDGRDRIEAGAGSDTLDGGTGDDVLSGGAGADILRGGVGMDTADYTYSAAAVRVSLTGYGQTGSGLGGDAQGDTLASIERVYGSGYDDQLIGGRYGDAFFGQGGNDLLEGHVGNDQLVGGNGADTILGGYGADRIQGGNGADSLWGDEGGTLLGDEQGDTFVFGSAFTVGFNGQSWTTYELESTPGARDTIFDFDRASGDLIDLTGIDANTATTSPGNDAFTFLGRHAFSGQAGELRYWVAKEGAIVQGDVTGDGVADFELQLANVHVLGSDAFLL